MRRALIGYLGALACFVAIDAVWLGVLMGPHYRAQLGPLAASAGLLLATRA
uniref:DUF2177 family protein n=1 Tax=Methylibium sp. TaxID=2067992 RepID=UPI0038620C95